MCYNLPAYEYSGGYIFHNLVDPFVTKPKCKKHFLINVYSRLSSAFFVEFDRHISFYYVFLERSLKFYELLVYYHEYLYLKKKILDGRNYLSQSSS